jgi:chorismate-pyruvate lyase
MRAMPELSRTKQPAAEEPADPSNSLVFPLSDFYRRNKHALPPLEEIESARIPQPYKSLLVHQHDMTSTLEKFHRGTLRLRIVSRARRENEYFREVALQLDGSNKPVEFGAIKINLDLFPPDAQTRILEEHWPLGRILKESRIAFTSQPRGFLRIASDRLINEVLLLHGAHRLFGRRNTLFNSAGQSLAEIVEILPPA